jgi:hypothetical protein
MLLVIGAIETTDAGFGGDDGSSRVTVTTSCWPATGTTSSDVGDGDNVVLGDLGFVIAGLLMETSDPGFGGDDEITAGEGSTSCWRRRRRPRRRR